MLSTLDCDYTDLLEQRGVKCTGPMFYIEPLDEIVHSLPKKLAVIGGFSGCYKTTTALNIVYNNAINLGYSCCFLSLEMETEEIHLRLLVRHAQHQKFRKYNCVITLQKAYLNNFSQVEKDFLYNEVTPDLKNNPAYGQIIVAGPEDASELFNGFDSFISKMDQRLLCLRPDNKLDLLVIDYIQLLARFSGSQSKGISDQFKIVAQLIRYLRYITHNYNNQKGISIIVLSQLNRISYTALKERLRNPRIKKEDKYKDLYDLTSISESSEIVNAADLVLTIYSDDILKEGSKAVIQLLKNRLGNTIEEGIEIAAFPDISYVGDFNQQDKNCPSYHEEMQEFVNNLIMGLM